MAVQFGGMYRRAVITLAPPVVAGAVVVTVPMALAHRLPGRVDGADGVVEGLPWDRVVVEGLVWAALALVWGVAWLYARRGVAGGQRWVAAAPWVGSVVTAGYVLQLIVRNLDLAGAPARPEPWWASPPAVLPVLVV